MAKKALIFVIILIMSSPIFLAVNSSVRRSLYFLVTKVVPKSFFITNVKRNLIHRDFDAVNVWLSRYLAMTKSFSKGNNTLLPGLIDVAEFAIKRVRFNGEMESLLPFLSEMVKNWPELVESRVWLARSLGSLRPKEALKNLKIAEEISSVDERIYREAINISLKNGLGHEVEKWCAKYKSSQLGGPHNFHYDTIFEGTGLRDLALEIINEQGVSKVFPNSGLQLNETRDYSFSTDRLVLVNNLKLHLGIVPGVKVSLKEMRFFQAGKLKKVFAIKDLLLSSSHGFLSSPGTILSVDRNPETVRIFTKEKEKIGVDKVIMKIRFEKLPMTNAAGC
ncbi:hypothetical protein OAK75_00445 [Bacteriovoracales bacterium]|nr:hypothetical protein [Bacteriovoracales bacterium]